MILYQIIVREGVWDRSEFPHPLVTLDYEADGNLLAVTAPGVSVRQFDEDILIGR